MFRMARRYDEDIVGLVRASMGRERLGYMPRRKDAAAAAFSETQTTSASD